MVVCACVLTDSPTVPDIYMSQLTPPLPPSFNNVSETGSPDSTATDDTLVLDIATVASEVEIPGL